MAKLQSERMIFDIKFKFRKDADEMSWGIMECNLTKDGKAIDAFSLTSMPYLDEYESLLAILADTLETGKPDYWQPTAEPDITIAIYPEMYFPFLPSKSKIVYVAEDLQKEWDEKDKLKAEKGKLPDDDFTIIIELDQFTPGQMYTGDGLGIHMIVKRYQLEKFMEELKDCFDEKESEELLEAMEEKNANKKFDWQLKGESLRQYTLDTLNTKIIKASELRRTKEERKKNSLSFDFSEENLFINTENEEKWKEFPKDLLDEIKSEYTRINNNYTAIDSLMISNYGRVKINGDIKIQIDKYGQTGYLQIEGYPGLGMVYNLVAKTWLEKPTSNCSDCLWDVHHITNNGYDNRPENLIWLKRCDHSMINHKSRS